MCRRVGCLGCRPDAANRLRTRGGTVSVRRFGTNGSSVLCEYGVRAARLSYGATAAVGRRSAVPRPA